MKMRRLAAMGLAAAMMVSMCVPAMADTTDSNVTTKDYTLTFMADPTVVDGGFVYEPVNYTIPAGTSEDTTLGELLQANNVEFQGSTSYISGFPCAAAKTFALSDAQKAAFPDAAFDTRIMVDPASAAGQDGYLSEKEFTGYAGWMMTVDNQTDTPDSTLPYGTYYYSLGSKISELEKYGILDDNQVVLEMFFSLNMGADIGMSDAYLPTEITTYGTVYSYDWSGPSVMVSKIVKNDRTALVSALASNSESIEYDSSLAVLKNLTSTTAQIDAAIKALAE